MGEYLPASVSRSQIFPGWRRFNDWQSIVVRQDRLGIADGGNKITTEVDQESIETAEKKLEGHARSRSGAERWPENLGRTIALDLHHTQEQCPPVSHR